MSKIDDGGSAFPQIVKGSRVSRDGEIWYTQATDGMSLRDWFAGQALAGLARDIGEDATITRRNNIVSVAYEFADAMIAAKRAAEKEEAA